MDSLDLGKSLILQLAAVETSAGTPVHPLVYSSDPAVLTVGHAPDAAVITARGIGDAVIWLRLPIHVPPPPGTEQTPTVPTLAARNLWPFGGWDGNGVPY